MHLFLRQMEADLSVSSDVCVSLLGCITPLSLSWSLSCTVVSLDCSWEDEFIQMSLFFPSSNCFLKKGQKRILFRFIQRRTKAHHPSPVERKHSSPAHLECSFSCFHYFFLNIQSQNHLRHRHLKQQLMCFLWECYQGEQILMHSKSLTETGSALDLKSIKQKVFIHSFTQEDTTVIIQRGRQNPYSGFNLFYCCVFVTWQQTSSV